MTKARLIGDDFWLTAYEPGDGFEVEHWEWEDMKGRDERRNHRSTRPGSKGRAAEDRSLGASRS